MNKIEKCSASQKGRVVVSKGSLEKRIYTEELENYLKLGWQVGISEEHRLANKKAHKGQKPGNANKKATDAARKKMSEAAKGRKPGNAGLDKTDPRVAGATQKSAATKLEKFGNGFGNQNMSEQHKQNISKALKGKKKYLSPETLRIKLSKDYITKKKNNTFNTSLPEEQLYETLLKENPIKTIYRQYKDPVRYPFYCDFYIVEDDLFIELNAHGSHGGKPFDADDPECQQKLAEGQAKAKTSKFYQTAIETGTVRDVAKKQWAEKFNLNYKVIY